MVRPPPPPPPLKGEGRRLLESHMAIYTVHEPPLKRYDTAADPDRFVFVRDGFSWSAFLFGPLWVLRHRMWLVLLLYVGLMIGVHVGLRRLALPSELAFV